MKIYFDFNNWWIGYYRGPYWHFICPLPTLVISWKRRSKTKPYVSSIPKIDEILMHAHKDQVIDMLKYPKRVYKNQIVTFPIYGRAHMPKESTEEKEDE